MKCLSSCTDVLHRPLILIISRCCFAEDGTEMYQHVKRTCNACTAVVFAHQTDCFVAFLLPLPSAFLELPNCSMHASVAIFLSSLNATLQTWGPFL